MVVGFVLGFFSFFSSIQVRVKSRKAAVSSLVLCMRSFEETSSSPTLNSVIAHKQQCGSSVIMSLSRTLKILNSPSTGARLNRSLHSLSILGNKPSVATKSFHLNSANLATNPITSTSKRGLASMMSMVKELREASGAPIVDCKKALTENDGDIEKSLDWLRQHGTAKASKKLGDREAEEGLVACAVSEDGKSASIVKVSSETDFAGKSDAFVGLACHVAGATLNSSSSGDLDSESSVLGLEYDSKTVQIALEEAIVAIRENLGVKKAVKLTTGDDGLLVAYVHGKADGSSDAGLAAAVVEIAGSGVEDNIEVANAVGKRLAMHVVAAKPTYLTSECIPDDVIEKEKEILKSQVRNTIIIIYCYRLVRHCCSCMRKSLTLSFCRFIIKLGCRLQQAARGCGENHQRKNA